VKRSRSASVSPAARSSARSPAFASRTSASRSVSSSASRASAAFRSAALAIASSRDACFAEAQTSATLLVAMAMRDRVACSVGSTVADAGQIEGDEARADGAALARGWLENSPFVSHLGMRLKSMEPGRAVLALPYREELPTMGEVVHGGAISSLVDTAAAA